MKELDFFIKVYLLFLHVLNFGQNDNCFIVKIVIFSLIIIGEGETEAKTFNLSCFSSIVVDKIK